MNLISLAAGLPLGAILRTIAAVRVFVSTVNKANADGRITVEEWYDLVVGLVLAIGDIFEIKIPVPTAPEFEEDGHGDAAADARSRIVAEINASLKSAGV